ncbi:hypothetical protein GCM10007320_38560 [Pseudorhodoferax aquiterrae]|uniref:Uncharacterized protein n=1 Tax=Pseudorhodoferax aquiterrae TaxID=747304 RepID=A0ABQ3G5V3_9BURK|nr:hypothetical protein GCM10007320_38560 [Pseudorhodoferax aquiterrae]
MPRTIPLPSNSTWPQRLTDVKCQPVAESRPKVRQVFCPLPLGNASEGAANPQRVFDYMGRAGPAGTAVRR